jgi:hypothetical protein
MDKSIEYRVWEIISTEEDLLEQEFSSESSDAQRDAVRYAMDLWMKFNDLQLHLHHTFNTVRSASEKSDNREVEYYNLISSHPEKEALDLLFKNEEIDNLIWKKLEPESSFDIE